LTEPRVTPRSPRRSAAGRFAALLATFLLLIASPRDAAAQTRADSAAVLLATAQQFEAAGQLEVADALFDHILGRFGDTAAAGEVRRLRAVRPRAAGERSGRVELQVFGTLYGAWVGLAVPLMLEADGPEAYGLGLLLGTPAGFLASRAYARSHSLTEGQARAISFGGLWGSWQGIGWANALDVGSGEDSIDERIGVMLGGGLAGIGIGAYLAAKPIGAGKATAVSFGGLWGTWFGLALGVLAEQDDDLLQAALVGGNLGLIATSFWAPPDITRSRARLISIAGVLGGIAGGGVSLLLSPDDDRIAILPPLVGSLAGLAIGETTTRESAGGGGGGGDGNDTGALFEVRDGRLGLGMPLPYPTLLRIERAGVASWKPAAGLTLLRARF
jgi:hypothetical protein